MKDDSIQYDDEYVTIFSREASLLRWQGLSGAHRNLLIDGWVTNTYNQTLRHEIQFILSRQEVLDLLILSHIDADPIGGLLRLIVYFGQSGSDSIWVNRVDLLNVRRLYSPISSLNCQAVY